MGCEQSWRLGGNLEGEAFAEFDLGEEHVEGVPGLHAELIEDFFGFLEPAGTRARNRVVDWAMLRCAQNCPLSMKRPLQRVFRKGFDATE